MTGCHRNKVNQFQRKKDSEQLCEDKEAVVQLLSGEIIGIHCKAYNYTGKALCSERDVKKYEREEIHCMKNLKEGRGGWI
eukprot:1353486-Ditylum_brightwellii.AAC.1